MSQPFLKSSTSKILWQNEVLKDISLTIHKGEVISIIGSSGSGKSILPTLYQPSRNSTEGEILYHGENKICEKRITSPPS